MGHSSEGASRLTWPVRALAIGGVLRRAGRTAPVAQLVVEGNARSRSVEAIFAVAVEPSPESAASEPMPLLGNFAYGMNRPLHERHSSLIFKKT